MRYNTKNKDHHGRTGTAYAQIEEVAEIQKSYKW